MQRRCGHAARREAEPVPEWLTMEGCRMERTESEARSVRVIAAVSIAAFFAASFLPELMGI